MSVFITGDRQLAVFYPGQVAVEMLRAVNAGHKIVTGTNGGVESMVRGLAEAAGVEVDVIEQSTLDTGKVDWDSRHAQIPADTRVVVIHADPHSSHITKSVLAVVPEERVELRTPADLLA